jgi:hypothetical protein
MQPQPCLNLLTRLGHPQKTPWNVWIIERYRHGAGVVTSLAPSLRGGPLKNARLVAWDGAQVMCTCRVRHAEADGTRPAPVDNWITWLILGGPFLLALFFGDEGSLNTGRRE